MKEFQFKSFLLFVAIGDIHWSIRPSFKGKTTFLRSGQAGQACPAHPGNKVNQKLGRGDWGFQKKGGNGDWVFEGIHLQCSVHKYE